MNAILNVARLHLMLLFQDRSTYIQAFAVPIVLMLVLSLALNEDNFVLELRVDVVDQDGSPLSAEFVQSLLDFDQDDVIFCVYQSSELAENCDLTSEDTFASVGEERLSDQVVAATILIPAGFEANLLAGQPVAVEYRSDEQLNTQTFARTTVNAVVTQFNSSLQVATAGVTTTETALGGYADATQKQADFDQLRQATAESLVIPPITVQSTSTGEEEEIIGLGARQSVPGMGCMFVMFSLLALSQFMVEERTQGTLPRLLTMPTARINIVLGKILGAFVFGFIQFAVFVVVGVWVGIDWGGNYPALALLIAAYCLAGTALGFMLSTFVRTVAQAGSMATLFGLILAPLGGAWWPLTIVPPFMRTIGHLSPIAWAMDGFQELLYFNGGVTDILPMVGALVIFATLFIGIAAWNFSYE